MPLKTHSSDISFARATREQEIASRRAGPRGAVLLKTNAKKGRFYRSLKGEHLDHLELLTRDQAEREIFAYIEMFYNRGGQARKAAQPERRTGGEARKVPFSPRRPIGGVLSKTC